MKLRALMNRLEDIEDIGEDREVIVRIDTLDGVGIGPVSVVYDFDVVGAEPDDKAAHEDGATVRLILRERPASD